MPRALITGITGQDGSYLTEFLLDKGYEVHGMVRRTSDPERSRLNHLYADAGIYGKRLLLHYADLDDPTTMRRVLVKSGPDEIYHLAGQSHVGLSFEIPESTCEMMAMGTLRLLEMIRDLPSPPRLFHAASSEIFGRPAAAPQDENTPRSPVNPYGCAKTFASSMVTIYRQSFKLFACNGIMYNHESPRRGENFVTRKITRAVAHIKAGLQDKLFLGNIDASRDWGYAGEYVEAMWLMLQQDQPDDYIIATNESHSIREFLEVAFRHAGLDWQQCVEIDPRYYRPTEVELLTGDYSKARRQLGWEPKTKFADLVRLMVDADVKQVEDGLASRPRIAPSAAV